MENRSNMYVIQIVAHIAVATVAQREDFPPMQHFSQFVLHCLLQTIT